MNARILHRKLWITPAVRWFLVKCGPTPNARDLTDDIVRALDGRDTKDGCSRLSAAPTFLLFILDPAHPDGPERVLVWHGPTDGGAFYKPPILEKALPYGINLT